jgi:O-methyltransferase domain/Dimerisation domain
MSGSEPSQELPPAWQFHQLMTSYYVPQAIYVAAQLGLADQLARHPLTADELARATATDPAALNLLLYALSSVGIFAITPDGTWRLTPLATYLQSDTPHSQRGWALFHGGVGYRAWLALKQTIETGGAAFARAFGDDFYGYMATHPEIAAEWDTAMNQTARNWLGALTDSYDFSGLTTIVDVGGGQGTLLAMLLQALPDARGVLVDLPHVVAGAGPVLNAAGVADRCTIVGGDAFQAVPQGGDAYIMARVLLNWDDASALRLLHSCRHAMHAQSRLLVIDVVQDEAAIAEPGVAFGDLNLLVQFGGWQRSAAAFRALFKQAGLSLVTIFPTQSHFKILEGRVELPSKDILV